MWRADVIHCGAAYGDFNARAFAYLEPKGLPDAHRRKADKDGNTQTFVFQDAHVVDAWAAEAASVVAASSTNGAPKRKAPRSAQAWAKAFPIDGARRCTVDDVCGCLVCSFYG